MAQTIKGLKVHGVVPAARAFLRPQRTRLATCPRCALPVGPFETIKHGCAACRGRSLGFDSARTLGEYEGILRTLCLQIKQERNAWLVPWLVKLLARTYKGDFADLPVTTWVVPIPLHWRRFLERGYNQAEALAQSLAANLQLELHQPLRRIKYTGHLAGKTASERIEAMRGVFSVYRPRFLRGRTILLIDDILTTGATCGAAARVLKQAGARKIFCCRPCPDGLDSRYHFMKKLCFIPLSDWTES